MASASVAGAYRFIFGFSVDVAVGKKPHDHQTWPRYSISSSVFADNRRQVPPCHPGLPVLPQSGDICAVFGLVVALCEQLRETGSVRKHRGRNQLDRKSSTKVRETFIPPVFSFS